MKFLVCYQEELAKQFNEAKKQRGGFLSMLLGTLGTSLLRDTLTDRWINRAGEGIARPCYGNKRQDYEGKIDF